ncbi:ead/Ea22-like family protein [Desulfovibrio piger]|uniref:ead/Ea22-like family protein n=1 Tax=Desulfovibrio piger TaxID=901 RepID=UPI0026EC4E2D|nr:ead/Ea22-like family protein [Desulfovibrio piger]
MSDERNPNDRSEAALRERLVIAEKAVPKGEKTIWTADFASPHETCVRDAFTERILTMEDYTDQATAAHIAASSPDVVQADIEEILLLRQEVARLNKEADWLAESLDIITRFCAPEVINDLKYKCWREAARNAVEKLNG